MDDTTNVQYESEIKKSKSTKEKGCLNASEPVVTSLTSCIGNCAPLGIDYRFSSITKLLRVTALALRFINRLSKSCSPKGPPNKFRNMCFRNTVGEVYSEEELPRSV